MSGFDLARGIRDHRAFGRRSVATYNSHLANAVHFACLIEDGRALIEPLAWSLLVARGGDPEAETSGDPHDDGVMRDYLDAGWRRIAQGEEDFDILLRVLHDLCHRRKISLSRRDVPAVFWLAPLELPEMPEAPAAPDRAAVLAAMERLAAEGGAEAGAAPGRWFVRHPESNAIWPARLVWQAAGGVGDATDERATEALRGLTRLEFRMLAVDQPGADIAESAESLGRLPAGFEGAERQISRNPRERDAAARRACERHYRGQHDGRLLCEGCGLDFGASYGARGEGFMHFHDLNPPGDAEVAVSVDGVRDLVPLCPNCHAMVHRGPELLGLAELRGLLGRAERQA